IQKAIRTSDLLVFLISPESVTKGRYTLTELSFARQQWRAPRGHVLPVVIAPTPIATVPTYLKAVTLLEPEGNIAAETAAAVEKLQGWSRSRSILLFAVLGLATGALSFLGFKYGNNVNLSRVLPSTFGVMIVAPILPGIVFGVLVPGCSLWYGLRD